MKLRRLVLVVSLLSGSVLTASNPVTAHVVDGNPASTDEHQVSVSRNVNYAYSQPHPCSENYGPGCSVHKDVLSILKAMKWDGVPNDSVRIALCNLQVVTPPVGRGAQDGFGDPARGCDWGNARVSQLDSDGECCVGAPHGFELQMPSSKTLSQYSDYPTSNSCRDRNDGSGITGCNTQPAAVCPPTPSQIAAGWTCVVEISDPNTPARQPTHGGYRSLYLKSPIPSMACGGAACPSAIPTGTVVTVSGVQFPCKITQPDDTVGTPNVYDGTCLKRWTNKMIWLKRASTKTIEARVTPTSQTAGFDGSYSVTFVMPSVRVGGEGYKIVTHAPDCSPPCDSGTFNAFGKFFVHQ